MTERSDSGINGRGLLLLETLQYSLYPEKTDSPIDTDLGLRPDLCLATSGHGFKSR